uniref:Uncharacterized protein n=1 Tax=Mycolicibacterium gilvum (strain PYR-GCK) TaxID=350054 RepID=A4T3C3_MYCGI|nr:hypothetical protein Mflv_0607 [Mycolicibacterium gilvum PYR-GCK]
MILSSVLPAIGLFIVTNIDDIIVLSLFFARGAGQRGTTSRITAGQYLGFAGIRALPPCSGHGICGYAASGSVAGVRFLS